MAKPGRTVLVDGAFDDDELAGCVQALQAGGRRGELLFQFVPGDSADPMPRTLAHKVKGSVTENKCPLEETEAGIFNGKTYGGAGTSECVGQLPRQGVMSRGSDDREAKVRLPPPS
jgi:hypothetical protein